MIPTKGHVSQCPDVATRVGPGATKGTTSSPPHPLWSSFIRNWSHQEANVRVDSESLCGETSHKISVRAPHRLHLQFVHTHQYETNYARELLWDIWALGGVLLRRCSPDEMTAGQQRTVHAALETFKAAEHCERNEPSLW